MENKAKRQKVTPPSPPLEQWSIGSEEADERSALGQIFDKLSGKNWTRSDNWNTRSPLAEWYGVRVDTAGRVNVLELSKNNVCGRLELVVPDLLRLKELNQLWLSENKLTGPLPAWLAEKTKLTILDVGSNSLRGALSPSFASSELLTWFDYVGGENQLTSFWRGSVQNDETAQIKDLAAAGISIDVREPLALSAASVNPSTSSSDSSNSSSTSTSSSTSSASQQQHISQYPNLWKVNIVKHAISPNTCLQLINEAEKYAAEPEHVGNRPRDYIDVQHQNNSGWSQNRHKSYSTTDIDVSLSPELLDICNQALESSLLPTMAKIFGFHISELGIEDMFVAKYDMKGQKELREHRDGSELSFVLALNGSNNEYEGGGTLFRNSYTNSTMLIKPDNAGDCVMFCGRQFHSGLQITKGTRYILTGFVRIYTKDVERKKMVEEIVAKETMGYSRVNR